MIEDIKMTIRHFIEDLPSPVTHSLMDAAICTLLTLAFGPAAGFLTPAWGRWFRESNEVERTISPRPWYYGFDIRNWSMDNHLDVWPSVAVCAVVAWMLA